MTTRASPRPGTLVLITDTVLFDTKGQYSLTLTWSAGSAEVVAEYHDLVFVSG